MKKHSSYKILLLLFFCLMLGNLPYSNAAIPIKEKAPKEEASLIVKAREEAQKIMVSRQKSQLQSQHSGNDDDEEDSGIYGILSLVTAILAIFPAAIVLGIIGSGKNRKLQGLAVAGLIIGICEAILFLLVLALFLIFLSAV